MEINCRTPLSSCNCSAVGFLASCDKSPSNNNMMSEEDGRFCYKTLPDRSTMCANLPRHGKFSFTLWENLMKLGVKGGKLQSYGTFSKMTGYSASSVCTVVNAVNQESAVRPFNTSRFWIRAVIKCHHLFHHCLKQQQYNSSGQPAAGDDFTKYSTNPQLQPCPCLFYTPPWI